MAGSDLIPPAVEVREDGIIVKQYLHEVTDDAYPSGFNVGYAQMELPFGQPLALGQCCGGFNMRRWADFGDAAFVGQFALTVQSAIAPSGISYFPVLEDVLTQAYDLPADAMPIARDLHDAWERSVATLRQVSPTTPGVADKCSGWLEKTDGDIRNLARMPEQAQRSISQSVVAVQVQTFRDTVRNDPDGGSAARYDNWLAECNAVASAAWQATAWVQENEGVTFLVFFSIKNDCWSPTIVSTRRWRAVSASHGRSSLGDPATVRAVSTTRASQAATSTATTTRALARRTRGTVPRPTTRSAICSSPSFDSATSRTSAGR